MRLIPIGIILLFLVSCATPLPSSKHQYVGIWKSDITYLHITADGRLDYKTGNSASKMPIISISDTAIKAGALGLTTTLRLGGKPIQEHGLAVLIVNGEKLYKADIYGHFPQAHRIPSEANIREMMSRELNVLADSISTRDFSVYINNSSKQFQHEFTNAMLKDNYLSFYVQNSDIKQWLLSDFVFDEDVFINEHGVLFISGHYSKLNRALKFKSRFTFSLPRWKNLGMELEISKK